MNKILTVILVLAIMVGSAQETKKKSRRALKAEKKAQEIAETKEMMDGKSFVFLARNANPMRWRTINLTTPYDVVVKNDSIFSYLPYFGRSYTAVYGSTQSPLIFESPIESFDMERTKRDGYRVEVNADNKSDNVTFMFDIGQTGSVSLIVTSMNRQSISFFGDLQSIENYEKSQMSRKERQAAENEE